jgi:signal transduction histidine kinase
LTLSPDYRQMLRAAGLITVACVAVYLPFCTTPGRPVLTALLLAAFVALFWRSTAPRAFDAPGGYFEIVGQSTIAWLLTWQHPFFLLASLMVIVSWQAGLRLPARSAAGLAVAQTVASALVLMLSLGRPEVLTYVGAALGFQVFGLAAGALAHREARARADLALALETLAQGQARRLVEARQDERLEIARDLHDELGHGLVALSLTLSAADRAVPGAKGHAHLSAATQLAADLLDRLRDVVGQMREPTPAALALGPALNDLVSAVADRRFEIRLSIDGCDDPVDGAQALTVLRLVQEAITNAVRHGGAAMSAIDVRVSQTPEGRLTVAVQDNGAGAETVTPGNGLNGMCERTSRLGGSVRWASCAGGGFGLQAELPGCSRP